MHCAAELDRCSKSSDSVATTIQCCHGCQSWALVSENGRWACQSQFKPQACFFLSLSLFHFTEKPCTIEVYVSVCGSGGAFRRLCIIYCSFIMDQSSPLFCVRPAVHKQSSTERMELIKITQKRVSSHQNIYIILMNKTCSHIFSLSHEHINAFGFIWACNFLMHLTL